MAAALRFGSEKPPASTARGPLEHAHDMVGNSKVWPVVKRWEGLWPRFGRDKEQKPTVRPESTIRDLKANDSVRVRGASVRA
jgi:hypothetical protein